MVQFQKDTLDAMMKRVVSALSCARVLAMWVPSMLDTNHTRGPPLEYGFRASVTIKGPYSSSQFKIRRPTERQISLFLKQLSNTL